MDELQARLQRYCERAFPAKRDIQVRNLVDITSGWECDVYSFHLEHGARCERRGDELILRMYLGGDIGLTGSSQEFHAMTRLHGIGYPVPEVLALEQDSSPLGRPFVIMEAIEGRVLWQVLRGSDEEEPWDLLRMFTGLFARLHALEWRRFAHGTPGRDAAAPFAFADRELARCRSLLAPLPECGLHAYVEWCEARRDQVPCREPSPIHWDYHPSNLLLRDDGSAVVIDWTQAETSDARFDLAWTLVVVGTQQNAEWRDFVLEEYERLRGAHAAHLDWFEVIVGVKRLGFVLVALAEGPESLGMRADAIADIAGLMAPLRRVYDLLVERTGIRAEQTENLLASYLPERP